MTFEEYMNKLNTNWEQILDDDTIVVCQRVYNTIHAFEKNNNTISENHTISDSHLATAYLEVERFKEEFKSTVLELMESESKNNVPRGTYKVKGYRYGK